MARAKTDGARSLRSRLLPRSIAGTTALLVSFSIGSAFSGTVLYTYYEYRLDANEKRVQNFVKDFDERFNRATGTIDASKENAKTEIEKALEPLRQIRAEGDTINELGKKLRESMWFVRTLDEAGQPSVGSAFVVASDSDQSLLLTSYSVVRAATKSPGPAVLLRQGGEEIKAQLWTWQEERDLALLVLDKGSLPKLTFSGSPAKTGERVFAVSGLGASGTSISQGFVSDVSASAIQHDAAVGAMTQGGPLVDSKGAVLALASRGYTPLGFTSEALFFAVPIRAACEKVLQCPSGTPSGAGAKR